MLFFEIYVFDGGKSISETTAFTSFLFKPYIKILRPSNHFLSDIVVNKKRGLPNFRPIEAVKDPV